ncbi:gp53-like domain-containing protein [Escherichia coli]|uniref:gp53-like domain-containing protein n=2 Tax=Escherichia coli TaxID=562 RepID=UPI00360599A6
MHRIDTKTAQKDKFGAGKNGFSRGNPQTGTPATDLDDDYFDMLQEELCSVVEASGASLEKARHDQLLTALRALLLSRKNPFGDIKSDGTVKTALENLGLGEAAKRNVGTGENQVPDMNSFGNSLTANGYQKLPGGMIIQWGSFSVSPTGGSVGTVDITLPVAFPAACRSVNALISTNDPSARSVGFDIGSTNRTKIRFTYTSATTNSIYWMAVGY